MSALVLIECDNDECDHEFYATAANGDVSAARRAAEEEGWTCWRFKRPRDLCPECSADEIADAIEAQL